MGIAQGFIDLKWNLKPLKSGMSGLKSEMTNAGRTMRRALLVGLGAAVALTAVISKTVMAASDLQETMSKFEAVFKDLAAPAKEWVEGMAVAVGRSQPELLKFMATLQDTFVPFGFARDKAFKLSQVVTQLGLDLASFNNMADDEAIQLLTSALVGNHEAVRRFGILITEATLNEQLLKMGIEGGSKAATEQQKVLARLTLMLKMSSDAQGDALRTAGSFANRFKALKANIGALAVSIGEQFLPFATKLVTALSDNIGMARGMIVSFIQIGKSMLGVEESGDDLTKKLGDVFSYWKEVFAAMAVVAATWSMEIDRIMIETMSKFESRAKGLFKGFAAFAGQFLQWMKTGELEPGGAARIGGAMLPSLADLDADSSGLKERLKELQKKIVATRDRILSTALGGAPTPTGPKKPIDLNVKMPDIDVSGPGVTPAETGATAAAAARGGTFMTPAEMMRRMQEAQFADKTAEEQLRETTKQTTKLEEIKKAVERVFGGDIRTGPHGPPGMITAAPVGAFVE